MIRDLSETLAKILEDPALATRFPELAAALVVFDRPTDIFSPAQTSLDLFLYDIRENTELRSNEPTVERVNGEAVIRRPPRRIDCSYLVTAWPAGGADLPLQEHRLLGQTLQVLARHPTIPAAFLQGSLVGQKPPLPMITPQLDGLKSPADFWTAMGNKLRASFTVTVTVSVPVLPDVTGPIVTTLIAGYDPGTGTVQETLFDIGGRVLDGGGNGVANAQVDILDAGLRTRTDTEGRYVFALVLGGNRNFRVVATGFQPLLRTIAIPGGQGDYDFALTPI